MIFLLIDFSILTKKSCQSICVCELLWLCLCRSWCWRIAEAE